MISLAIQYASLFLGAALLIGIVHVGLSLHQSHRLRSRQEASARQVRTSLLDFEKNNHLVTVPPVGTPVLLRFDSDYLLDYHKARAGDRGTVVRHSTLNATDNGVLVNWGQPGDMVRMDLHELVLAPEA